MRNEQQVNFSKIVNNLLLNSELIPGLIDNGSDREDDRVRALDAALNTYAYSFWKLVEKRNAEEIDRSGLQQLRTSIEAIAPFNTKIDLLLCSLELDVIAPKLGHA